MPLDVAQPLVYIKQMKYRKKKILIKQTVKYRHCLPEKYPERQQLSVISNQMSGIHG